MNHLLEYWNPWSHWSYTHFQQTGRLLRIVKVMVILIRFPVQRVWKQRLARTIEQELQVWSWSTPMKTCASATPCLTSVVLVATSYSGARYWREVPLQVLPRPLLRRDVWTRLPAKRACERKWRPWNVLWRPRCHGIFQPRLGRGSFQRSRCLQ